MPYHLHHPNTCGTIQTPSVKPEADYGILRMHSDGYSTTRGHGIIAVTMILVETGETPPARLPLDGEPK